MNQFEKRAPCVMFGALIHNPDRPRNFRVFLVSPGEDLVPFSPLIPVLPTADVTAGQLAQLVGRVVGIEGFARVHVTNGRFAAQTIEPTRVAAVPDAAVLQGARYRRIESLVERYFPAAPALQGAPPGATLENLDALGSSWARVGDEIRITYEVEAGRRPSIRLEPAPLALRPFDTYQITRQGSRVTVRAVVRRAVTIGVVFGAVGGQSETEVNARLTTTDRELSAATPSL